MTGIKYDKSLSKLRYDLIPPGPLAEVAYVYTIGAQKYADRNWEGGMAWGRCFRALMQHAWHWWARGGRHDKGMHPLASVVFYCFALMEYENTHPQLDDRSIGYAQTFPPQDADDGAKSEEGPEDGCRGKGEIGPPPRLLDLHDALAASLLWCVPKEPAPAPVVPYVP